ncbi:MAG: selenocysteine-specific translation elongation factor [Clostridia bacterium]|nr:selenocysteine-specific translation elongation factor [Clostridia bacterium]
MKNIIIGTAGHIDHGKTSLIKALTGRETDRLEEEKKRGITIDLGFTYFNLSNGEKAGIIDVPGHEKFIKNMLAGVGGMDVVLMVIAADEGIMPQTREHLDILSILNIKQGIVVLTKKDMVEEDWLQMVEEEIKEEIQGSFLENAPIIPVSSITGEGIEALKQEMTKMTETAVTKNIHIPFRIPIDRVFSVDGFGTVITGTQIEGTLNTGDEVILYPTNLETKIRNIQVHGEKAASSYAGQRVAINLANVKKTDINRGDVLASKDALEETMMIDVKLDLLKSTVRELSNRTRVRFYHGTKEILCRVVLLDADILKAGEHGYAQLRLEEKIAVKKDDYFVLRFYSPMETIGGGIILDENPSKHKRYNMDVIEALRLRETGSEKDILDSLIKKYSKNYMPLGYIFNRLGKEKKEASSLLQQLVSEKKAIMLTEELVMHHSVMSMISKELSHILTQFHNQNPLKIGMGKEELRNRLFKGKNKWADLFLNYFSDCGIIKVAHQMVSLDEFKVKYSKKQLKIKTQIENLYYDNQFTVPVVSELIKSFEDHQETKQILQSLIEEGVLIKIDNDICLHHKNYNKSVDKLKAYLEKNGSITVADFRDLIGTSRKYALPILEYFDQMKITKNIEDARVLVAL